MGSRASRPPVLGAASAQLKAWVRGLVNEGGAPLLLDGDTDDREAALARASVAEFIRLYALELVGQHVKAAQELGASNESVSNALGVRPATAIRRYPNPKAKAGAPAASARSRAAVSGAPAPKPARRQAVTGGLQTT